MPTFTITKTKKIILPALLLATFIVLDRLLSFNSQALAINFSLIPIMLAAIILGPAYAALIGALGDLIGAIFWPFGPYNVGFTISSAITGLIFGIMLYQNPNKNLEEINTPIKLQKSSLNFALRAIISNVLVTILISIFLNSFWLKLMYEKAFVYFLGKRIIAQSIMLPIYIVLIIALEKLLKPILKKYVYKEIGR